MRTVPTYIAAAITVILWASAFPGMRAALVGYSPARLTLLRFLVASAALLIVAPLAKVRVPPLREIPKLALLGGVGITAYNLALNYGETRVPAGAASFLVNTVPIFTALLASVFLGERLRALGWLGLLVSFAGSLVIALGSGCAYRFNPWAMWILLAAIFQAVFFVLQKPLLRSYRPIKLTGYAIWSGNVFHSGVCNRIQGCPQHSSNERNASQRKRKRIEEVFGWMKSIGLLRKLRHRGLERVSWIFTFAAAAYNLVRIRNLIRIAP